MLFIIYGKLDTYFHGFNIFIVLNRYTTISIEYFFLMNTLQVLSNSRGDV